MFKVLNAAVPFALGAVVIVLVAGFINMFRGGSANLSQTLMRWRVGLQFVALLIILGAIWFKNG
ncbi:MAG: twin transmembrane helix small protein [Alsobacter sp.]